MEQSIITRLADGSLVRMTPSEIHADLEEGSAAGAKKAKAPPLEPDELDRLLEIFASNAHFTAVDIGDELILSCDGSGNMDSGTRIDELYSYQSHRGADIVELYHIDYSYKAVKTVMSFEQQVMKNAQLNLVAPLQYGAMPDLGRYSQPDGPIPNWSELLPLGAHRRGARRPGGGSRARRPRHGLRRRGHDRGRRRRHGLRHLGRRRRRRLPRHAARRRGDPGGAIPISASSSAWRASSCSACTGSSSSTASASPACGRAPGRRGGRGGRDRVRAGGQRQHDTLRGLERGARPGDRQTLRAGGAHSRCT